MRPIAFILISFFPTSAFAISSGWFAASRVRLGFTYSVFSGATEHSFAGNSQAFGIEFEAERSSQILGIMARARADYGNGSIPFNDGGTSRTLSFSHYAADLGFGLKIYPIPIGRGYPVRPYLSGTGDVGIASLKFGTSSLTALEKSYSSSALGYSIAAGIEAGPSFDSPGGKSFFAEIQLRRAKANLAGDSAFSLNCIKIVGGIGW